jgi:CHAT domain-containing protein
MKRMFVAVLATLAFPIAFGQSAPPPRSVADVLAVLDQYKPDPEKVNRLKAEVAKPPPQTTDKVDLLNFYMARADAAGQLGMVTQQLADLRKARELISSGDPQLWSIYGQIGNAEMQAGNFAAAMKMWDEAPSAARVGGQQIAAWAALSTAASAFGNRERARKGCDEAEGVLRSVNSSRAWQYFSNNWRALVERCKAGLLRLEGKHAEAELGYRQVLALWDEQIKLLPIIPAQFSPPPAQTMMRGAIGWESGNLVPTLLEQGKYAEAEASARNALKRSLEYFGKYSPATGSVVARLANVLSEQGRGQEAAALARAAIHIYEQIGAAPVASVLVNAKRLVGAALVNEGKHAEADALFTSLKQDLLKDPETAEHLGTGSFAWVSAQIRLGKTAAAVEQAREIYQTRHKRYGDAFYGGLEARGFYALALAADGKHDEALREYRATIPALLAAAGERAGAEGLGMARTRRMTRILEGYIRLLGHFAAAGQSPLGIDPVAEAFVMSDIARGSSVQRALVAASARAAIRDPQLAQIAREEQDAGQRIASLTAVLVDLLARPPEKSLPQVIAAMRKDIEDLRSRRADIKREIEKRFPDYANLIDPKPIPLDAARRTLAPGEALIVLYGTSDNTFVWAVPQQGPARFHVAKLGARERDGLVATLRRALDVGDAPLERFPQFDLAAAHRLFAELLAPVEPAWKDAKSLLVVPHGSLGQLPFSILVTQPYTRGTETLRFESYKGVNWLARRAAITQLPSVNTLASLRSVQRAQVPSKPFIGFGDPVFGPEREGGIQVATRGFRLRSAPFSEDTNKRLSSQLGQLARLADTADELEGIAGVLNVAKDDLFLRARASESNVKKMDLSERRVVAFATHGLVAGDLDGLMQPALALSNPSVTGEKDADGLLGMDEILALKLNADWVVLSACNTASAEGAGGEAVSGLGRAFFYAGARALLVSNWPVETVSAKLLTTDIFRRQAADPKLARAEALRQAMLHIMQNETGKGGDGKPLYAYAHPMFWAPFSLVGDGN